MNSIKEYIGNFGVKPRFFELWVISVINFKKQLKNKLREDEL